MNGKLATGHMPVVTAYPLALPMTVAISDPEAELVERLCRGERDAVEQAYVAHHAAIRAFARRLVGDAATAEDLVHDTFIALPRVIRRFRGDAALRAFLIGVAVNHARRHVRTAMRRRRAHERMAERDELRAPAPDASETLARKQLAARLAAALDELPLDQRVVFVLCDVEQRTSGEAAAIVGAPEGTVRTRLFHARRKLRAALEDAR
ncbi:MAG TPA: RNA polymerase sigma factor [Kofleriaceae bacterium]